MRYWDKVASHLPNSVSDQTIFHLEHALSCFRYSATTWLQDLNAKQTTRIK